MADDNEKIGQKEQLDNKDSDEVVEINKSEEKQTEVVDSVEGILEIPENVIELINKDPKKAHEILKRALEITRIKLIETNDVVREFISPALNNYFDKFIEVYGRDHIERHKGTDYEKGAKNEVEIGKENLRSLKKRLFEILDNYDGDLKEALSDLFLDGFLYIGKDNVPIMSFEERIKDKHLMLNGIYAKYYKTYTGANGEVNGPKEDFSPEKNLEILKKILENSLKINEHRHDGFEGIKTPLSIFCRKEEKKKEKEALTS